MVPKKPKCKAFVRHTRKGWKISLPHVTIPSLGGFGGGGVEMEPKVVELAGREALTLDMAQLYYCEEMRRAIKNEDIGRYKEMQRRRDEAIEKLTHLAEQKTEENLKAFVSENYEPIKSIAVGKGAVQAMAELERAHEEARPYIEVHGDVVTEKNEVGIEIKGGEIHAGRDVIGIQKIELSDEQLARALEIMQKNLPVVPNEELTTKIKAQEAKIGTERAAKAEARVVAGNKSLELGKKHLESREFKHATREFRDALKYLPESSEAAGDVYINLASAYAYQYKWDDALEAYTQAEEIGQELDKKPLLALAYNGTGTIYYSVSKHDKALEYFEHALAITRELGDKQGEGVTLNNIAAIYDSWGKYDRALEYHEKALEIFKEVGDRPGEGITLFNMATIYEKQGRVQDAINNLEEVVRIDEATKKPDMAQDMAYLERLKRTLKKQNSQ